MPEGPHYRGEETPNRHQLPTEGPHRQGDVCQPGRSDLTAAGPPPRSVRNAARIRLSTEGPHHQGDGNQAGVSSHQWGHINKGEETGTCGLKPEDLHQKGAGSEAGRRSLKTEGPKNKKGGNPAVGTYQQVAQSTESMGSRPE